MEIVEIPAGVIDTLIVVVEDKPDKKTYRFRSTQEKDEKQKGKPSGKDHFMKLLSSTDLV